MVALLPPNPSLIVSKMKYHDQQTYFQFQDIVVFCEPWPTSPPFCILCDSVRRVGDEQFYCWKISDYSNHSCFHLAVGALASVELVATTGILFILSKLCQHCFSDNHATGLH